MKNIFRIFKTDFFNITKNKAAIVVIVALMFLPSLYAWFNIIPSWDPYKNTEGLAVAVTNLDEGAEIEGNHLNIGDEIILSLISNKQLGWQFVSEEEAMKGVEHGDYYASIIIPEDFSTKLASVLTDDIEKPEINYYTNEKINAVAPKVTGAGASGIVDSIRSGFVKVANEAIFTAFDQVGIELETQRPSIEQFRHSIFHLEAELPEINRMIGVAKTNIDAVEETIDKVNNGIERASEIGEQAERLSAEMEQKLVDSDKIVQKYIPLVQQDLTDAQKVVQQIPEITDRISNKETDIDKLIDKLEKGAEGIEKSAEALQKLSEILQVTDQKLRNDRELDDIVQKLESTQGRLTQLKQIIDESIFKLENGDHLGVEVVNKIGELSTQLSNHLTAFDELYNRFIVPQISESIEKIESSLPLVKENLLDLQSSILFVTEMIQKTQNIDLPIDSDNLKNMQSRVDANRMRVDHLLNLFTSVNEMTTSDLLARPIDSLTKIQTRLNTVSNLLDQMTKAFERGENLDPAILSNIENELQEVNRFINTILNNEDTITHSFNNAIVKLKELDQMLNSKVDNLQKAANTFVQLNDSLSKLMEDPERLLNLLQSVSNRIDSSQQTISSISGLLERFQQWIDTGALANRVHRIDQVQNELLLMSEALTKTVDKVQAGKENRQALLGHTKDTAAKMDESINELLLFIEDELIPKYDEASKKANQALKDANHLLANASTTIAKVNELLIKANNGVRLGKDGLLLADEHFPELKQKITELADNIRRLEEKGDLDQLIDLMKNDPTKVSEFFADPLILNEHKLFPMPNYGSAMSPFFTTMALWVGALILVSSLNVDIENKHAYKSYEAYFGRFLTFWFIGLMQSFIVTMGDLYLLKTFVVHKLLFVLFGFLISTAFVLIVYTLVSVFGNTGKVLAIILLVMQLGSSGGTFPIQMTPVFFQKIHEFMPFTHALQLLREAAGGAVWSLIWKHIVVLLIYMIVALIIGVVLKKHINKSSDKFLTEARKSKMIM